MSTTGTSHPTTADATAQAAAHDGAHADPRTGDGHADPVTDAEALISAERQRIDQLDSRIIDLVRDRLAVSETIQRVRIESGGRRVHLSREMEILDHYSSELGRPGRDLAMTLLGLCRGQ